jgi:hypothetical protein
MKRGVNKFQFKLQSSIIYCEIRQLVTKVWMKSSNNTFRQEISYSLRLSDKYMSILLVESRSLPTNSHVQHVIITDYSKI